MAGWAYFKDRFGTQGERLLTPQVVMGSMFLPRCLVVLCDACRWAGLTLLQSAPAFCWVQRACGRDCAIPGCEAKSNEAARAMAVKWCFILCPVVSPDMDFGFNRFSA
jgi:hypothetical protein